MARGDGKLGGRADKSGGGTIARLTQGMRDAALQVRAKKERIMAGYRQPPKEYRWQVENVDKRAWGNTFQAGDGVSVKLKMGPFQKALPKRPSAMLAGRKGWALNRIRREARRLPWRQGVVSLTIPAGANADSYIRWKMRVPKKRIGSDARTGVHPGSQRYAVAISGRQGWRVIATAQSLRAYENAIQAWVVRFVSEVVKLSDHIVLTEAIAERLSKNPRARAKVTELLMVGGARVAWPEETLGNGSGVIGTGGGEV